MPRTTYCQNCIEDFDSLVLYKGNWVCEPCMRKIKNRPKIEEALPEWIHTDESLKVRKLQPGEVLPEARSSFSFGTPSRGAETGPFTLDVGLRWKSRAGQ